MNVRQGEDKTTWYRSERFYHTSEGWWIGTRENTEIGPFESQKDASMELCLYVREINTAHFKIAI